jgi:hypothetical protein
MRRKLQKNGTAMVIPANVNAYGPFEATAQGEDFHLPFVLQPIKAVRITLCPKPCLSSNKSSNRMFLSLSSGDFGFASADADETLLMGGLLSVHRITITVHLQFPELAIFLALAA